jgi:16S rRNA A1518/A1519 N6-dimethyltransferase RsmA/KsgA/DIM1 with predicted DNA glycosylase/AP lyase activity
MDAIIHIQAIIIANIPFNVSIHIVLVRLIKVNIAKKRRYILIRSLFSLIAIKSFHKNSAALSY